MTRPRLIRGLRIAWSVWWGGLCGLLILLWVISYWCQYNLSICNRYALSSVSGHVLAEVKEAYPVEMSVEISKQPRLLNMTPFLRSIESPLGFGFSDMPDWIGGPPSPRPIPHTKLVFVPHWFLICFCAIFAVETRVRWSKRFSLRTLLIATTLIAVVLGLIVWSIQ